MEPRCLGSLPAHGMGWGLWQDGPERWRLPDGSSGGAGGVKTDASTGAGGAVGTGGMGTDAGTGTGGAIGTGGVTSDAGAGVACSDDGGVGFAAVARQCTQDSDCTILTAATCCGADNARGIAKTQASAYAGCFALPPGVCSGLGCAEYLGYLTDTGKTTPLPGNGHAADRFRVRPVRGAPMHNGRRGAADGCPAGQRPLGGGHSMGRRKSSPAEAPRVIPAKPACSARAAQLRCARLWATGAVGRASCMPLLP